ncbi:hypothetical protein PanWU01x14_181740, partial [Parasponia andersonii]
NLAVRGGARRDGSPSSAHSGGRNLARQQWSIVVEWLDLTAEDLVFESSEGIG